MENKSFIIYHSRILVRNTYMIFFFVFVGRPEGVVCVGRLEWVVCGEAGRCRVSGGRRRECVGGWRGSCMLRGGGRGWYDGNFLQVFATAIKAESYSRKYHMMPVRLFKHRKSQLLNNNYGVRRKFIDCTSPSVVHTFYVRERVNVTIKNNSPS